MSTEERGGWRPGDPVLAEPSGWLRCSACGAEAGPRLSVPMPCPECGSPMVALEERDEVTSGKTIAPNVRPHRWAHATGEHRRTETHRGARRQIWRQVGWHGGSGFFYSLDEDPSRYEPASFQPLWILVDDEEIPTDGEIETLWAVHVAGPVNATVARAHRSPLDPEISATVVEWTGTAGAHAEAWAEFVADGCEYTP